MAGVISIPTDVDGRRRNLVHQANVLHGDLSGIVSPGVKLVAGVIPRFDMKAVGGNVLVAIDDELIGIVVVRKAVAGGHVGLGAALAVGVGSLGGASVHLRRDIAIQGFRTPARRIVGGPSVRHNEVNIDLGLAEENVLVRGVRRTDFPALQLRRNAVEVVFDALHFANDAIAVDGVHAAMMNALATVKRFAFGIRFFVLRNALGRIGDAVAVPRGNRSLIDPRAMVVARQRHIVAVVLAVFSAKRKAGFRPCRRFHLLDGNPRCVDNLIIAVAARLVCLGVSIARERRLGRLHGCALVAIGVEDKAAIAVGRRLHAFGSIRLDSGLHLGVCISKDMFDLIVLQTEILLGKLVLDRLRVNLGGDGMGDGGLVRKRPSKRGHIGGSLLAVAVGGILGLHVQVGGRAGIGVLDLHTVGVRDGRHAQQLERLFGVASVIVRAGSKFNATEDVVNGLAIAVVVIRQRSLRAVIVVMRPIHALGEQVDDIHLRIVFTVMLRYGGLAVDALFALDRDVVHRYGAVKLIAGDREAGRSGDRNDDLLRLGRVVAVRGAIALGIAALGAIGLSVAGVVLFVSALIGSDRGGFVRLGIGTLDLVGNLRGHRAQVNLVVRRLQLTRIGSRVFAGHAIAVFAQSFRIIEIQRKHRIAGPSGLHGKHAIFERGRNGARRASAAHGHVARIRPSQIVGVDGRGQVARRAGSESGAGRELVEGVIDAGLYPDIVLGQFAQARFGDFHLVGGNALFLGDGILQLLVDLAVFALAKLAVVPLDEFTLD